MKILSRYLSFLRSRSSDTISVFPVVNINTIQDPFVSKAISNWLSTVNEASYQPVFCEWLALNGHSIKSSIRNTNFEQGKDVISTDKNGLVHAFQLKGGKITLERWRSEVKREIEILIEGAIQHPEIDRKTNHYSYLVTNGDIDETVRADIISLNDRVWKESPLKIIEKGDLNTYFQKMSQGFLPDSLSDYKVFVELIAANGKDLVDIKKVSTFLEETYLKKRDKVVKEQIKRDISSIVLYTNLIMGPYSEESNYVSCVKILSASLSVILNLVDEYKLNDKYWLTSYEIIWQQMMYLSSELERYIKNTKSIRMFPGPIDREMIPQRMSAAKSVLYPFKLAQAIKSNDDWMTILDEDYQKKLTCLPYLWGEASYIPYIFLVMLIQKENAVFCNFDSKNWIRNLIDLVIRSNGRNVEEAGLKSIYIDLHNHTQMDIIPNHIDTKEDNTGYSYVLRSLILMLLLLDDKEGLSQRWKELTFFQHARFELEKASDAYRIHNEKGGFVMELLNKEESWKHLKSNMDKIDLQPIPPGLKRFPEFIPFLLSIYPHRLNENYLKLIFQEIN